MASGISLVTQLSTQDKTIQAQKTQLGRTEKEELIKVYCNNIFVGIAVAEAGKGELKLSEETKESIKVLTSKTETEIAQVFHDVLKLDETARGAAINKKLSVLVLFIENFSSNGRLRRQITEADVANLVDVIQNLEALAPKGEVSKRLAQCRQIISAFKVDKVLRNPVLKAHNELNLRYYQDTYHVDLSKLD